MLHPRPRIKNKGLSKVGKRANISTEIGAMSFMAIADQLMINTHDLIPTSSIKNSYRCRVEIGGVKVGKQSSTGINHLITMLSPDILERYNEDKSLIKGINQEPVYIRLNDNIRPEDFYLHSIKSESIKKFIVDPKKHGLKIAFLPAHLQPPIGMKM